MLLNGIIQSSHASHLQQSQLKRYFSSLSTHPSFSVFIMLHRLIPTTARHHPLSSALLPLPSLFVSPIQCCTSTAFLVSRSTCTVSLRPPSTPAFFRARASAKFQMSSSSFSSGFSEDTPLLSPDDTDRNTDNIRWSETWRSVRPYVTPSTHRLLFVALFSLLCELLHRLTSLLPGYGVKLVVDSLTNVKQVQHLVFPYYAILVFAAGNLFSALFDGLHDVSYNVVESDCSRRFSIDVYQHLLTLSLAFHLKRKTGEILKIMDRGIDSVDTIVHTVLFNILPTYVPLQTINNMRSIGLIEIKFQG